MAFARDAAVLAAVALFGAGPIAAAERGWQTAATIDVAALTELSGLAASRRQAGLFWALNDSGHPPRLYAVDGHGQPQAWVDVEAPALDWEDLAAFDWRGEPYLAIADTGDNLAFRRTVRVLLLPEPPAGTTRVRPARVIELRYPGGPRDVEALAVDAAAGQILLLEKRTPPARLYALDLEGPAVQEARVVAELAPMPALTPTLAQTVAGRRSRDAVTAMDFDAERGELVLMTYQRVLRFRKAAQQTWAEVLARAPAAEWALPRDGRLYEAVAIDRDGHLWAAPEGRAPPLLRTVD